MKAKTRKLFSWLLCLAMAVGMLPMSALADDSDTAQTAADTAQTESGDTTNTQGYILDGSYTTSGDVGLIIPLSYTIYVCQSGDADQTIDLHHIYALPSFWGTPAEDANFSFALSGSLLSLYKNCNVTIKKGAAAGSTATVTCYWAKNLVSSIAILDTLSDYLKTHVAITVLSAKDFETMKNGGSLVTFAAGTGYTLTALAGEMQDSAGNVTTAVPADTTDLSAWYPTVTVTDTTKHQDTATPWTASATNTYVPNLVANETAASDSYDLPGKDGVLGTDASDSHYADDMTVYPYKDADGVNNSTTDSDGHLVLPDGGSVVSRGTAQPSPTADTQKPQVLSAQTGEAIKNVIIVRENRLNDAGTATAKVVYDTIHVTDVSAAFTVSKTTAPAVTGYVATAFEPATVAAADVAAGNTVVTVTYAVDANADGVADSTQSKVTFNANGGKIGSDESVVAYLTKDVNYDLSSITATHDAAALNGKDVPVVFFGWTTDSSASGKIYASGDTLPQTQTTGSFSEETTLYAAWGYDADSDGTADAGKTAHTLTILYGEPTGTVTKTLTLFENQTYSVTSPAVTGYTASAATVSGTMGTADITVKVTYSANGGGSTGGGGSAGGGSSTGGGGSAGGGSSSGGSTTVEEPTAPTGSAPTLNKDEHFAFINGYADGTVRPNANITRAEVATIFYRLLSDSTRKEYYTAKNSFSDVAAGAWYSSAVSTLNNAGIITGYVGGTFKPDGAITREELAAIVTRFYDASTKTYNSDPYTDISASWARAYIDRAAELGVIHGYEDGTFRPAKNITRAETVTMVNNVLGRAPSKEGLLAGMKTFTDNADSSAWYYAAIQEATNSHDFTKAEGAAYETWTKINAPKDWAALEAEWAKG